MRAILILLFALCTLCAEGKSKYRLVWKDNFKGKAIDWSHWSKIPRGQPDWQRHMSHCDALYAVKDGHLILRGMANDGLEPGDTAHVLTGGVYTMGKFAVGYGKVEVRAKLHGARGAWPAIWMLPEGGKWPQDGEIDIMERLNSDSVAHQTVHSHYTFNLHQGSNPPQGHAAAIDPDGWNVYGVEIGPDSLVFRINGKRNFSYPRLSEKGALQYPFGTPFYLLIDMQLGGSWVGRTYVEDYPVEMWIDWVKVYEMK